MSTLFSRNKIIYVAVAALLLAGCAKYRAQQIKPLKNTSKVCMQEKERVIVASKVLSPDECETYFSSRSRRRIARAGYQPIQIAIKNNTQEEFVFEGKSINLPIEDKDRMIRIARFHPTERFAALGILGIFIAPIVFIPTAIIDGNCAHKANDGMRNDFSQKIIDNTSCVIIPGKSEINKVIFVKKDELEPILSLSLTGKNTKKKLNFKIAIK